MLFCFAIQAKFAEFLFHDVGRIRLRSMRQTPPGGIMAVVANPLEENQVGKEEQLSCRSLLFLGGVGG